MKNLHVDELKVISKYLKDKFKPQTLVDIGAMNGDCTDLFRDRNWNCFTVECNSNLLPYLHEKYSNYDNVKVVSKAIANENKKYKLYKSHESLGITSLLNFHTTHKFSEEVDAITFSDLVNEHSINNIDFLKIDIEGLDYFVLNDQAFQKITPKIVLVEFEHNKHKKINLGVDDLINKLTSYNYEVYIFEWFPIERYGIKHRFKEFYKYDGRDLNNNSWGNILAFSKKPNSFKLNYLVKKNINKF